MSEGKEGNIISRRNFIKGGAAVLGGTALLATQLPSTEAPKPPEQKTEREQDIETYQNAIKNYINPSFDPEGLTKVLSNDFLNQKVVNPAKNQSIDRLLVSKNTRKVAINPDDLDEESDGISEYYNIFVNPDEAIDPTQPVPMLNYSRDIFDEKMVMEKVIGFINNNKFSSRPVPNRDPKYKDEQEFEAEDMKQNLKKVFNITDDEWNTIKWNTTNIAAGNSMPIFSIEGEWETDGKRKRVESSKAGLVGLSVDHRPVNFGFTAENYEE